MPHHHLDRNLLPLSLIAGEDPPAIVEQKRPETAQSTVRLTGEADHRPRITTAPIAEALVPDQRLLSGIVEIPEERQVILTAPAPTSAPSRGPFRSASTRPRSQREITP